MGLTLMYNHFTCIYLKFILIFMDRPKVGAPSLDIHWTTIASGIDIKKPKIDIPYIGLDIYGPKLMLIFMDRK